MSSRAATTDCRVANVDHDSARVELAEANRLFALAGIAITTSTSPAWIPSRVTLVCWRSSSALGGTCTSPELGRKPQFAVRVLEGRSEPSKFAHPRRLYHCRCPSS